MWQQFLDWARDSLSDWTMSKIYIACAVAGGTLILSQTGLSLFGLGEGDVDADVHVDDVDASEGLTFLSLRAMAGFLTFFGLVGWGGVSSGWHPLTTIAIAFLAGTSVMLLIAVIMRFFKTMQADGTVKPEGAVGSIATVYLRIPGQRSGKGKITVEIQGRSQQFDALTDGEELPTGSECRVLSMTTAGTFEVGPLDGPQVER